MKPTGEYIWETLAEFTMYLKGQEDIFCHCSRTTINDRDLLYFGKHWQENHENDFTEFVSEPVSKFENQSISNDSNDDAEEELDVYDKPLVDFDSEFTNEIEAMKAMGLPLAFLGNPNSEEKKVPRFKICVSNESSSESSDNKKKRSKKLRKKEEVHESKSGGVWVEQLSAEEHLSLEAEFKAFWDQNGHSLVLEEWNKMYGDFVAEKENLSPEDTEEPSPLAQENLQPSDDSSTQSNETEVQPEKSWDELWTEVWGNVCVQEYNNFIERRTQEIIENKKTEDALSKKLEKEAVIDESPSVEEAKSEENQEQIEALPKAGMAYWLQKVIADVARNEAEDGSSSENHGNTNSAIPPEAKTDQDAPNTPNNTTTSSNPSEGQKVENGTEDDDEPPEEVPIIRSKRPHEAEDHDENTKHRLINSKAGRAFADLGFTFEPGQHTRYPDVKEVRAASVYFTAKDAVKRTKRLNINKKYDYDENGDMIFPVKTRVKSFLADSQSEADLEEETKDKEVINEEIENSYKNMNLTPKLWIHEPEVKKYWHQRYRLFSKFDEGIVIDSAESWFSITPEKIAIHLAERCQSDVIVDGFCGVGGNTIQFAKTCSHVIAIDIDPKKIEAAKQNARIYGVEDNIEFIVGDFFKVAPTITHADVIFLSPPWGGPQYLEADVFDLHSMIPVDGLKVFETALEVSENIAYYVPKNTNVDQIVSLAGEGGHVEIEQNILNTKVKAVTAYFGDLIKYSDDDE